MACAKSRILSPSALLARIGQETHVRPSSGATNLSRHISFHSLLCYKASISHFMESPGSDSWQWLEAQVASECLDWVDRQNATSVKYLDSLPAAQDLKSILQRLAIGDSRVPDHWIVGHLFRLRKTNDNKQGVLEMGRRQSDDCLTSWYKVIDINELGRTENETYELQSAHMPSCIHGEHLILPLSIKGADTIVLREIDLYSGTVVENGFRTINEGRISFAWIDNDHILISHCLNDGPAASTGWPRCVYLWERGSDLEDAKLVWQGESTDVMCHVTSITVRNKRCGLIQRVKDFSSFEFFLVKPDGEVIHLLLPEKQPLKVPPATTADHVLGTLLEPTEVDGSEYPAGTLVACYIDDTSPVFGKLSVAYVPREGEVNADLIMQTGLQTSQSRAYMTLTKRGAERCVTVEYHDGTWAVIEDSSTKKGCHRMVVSGDPYSDDVILEESGFVTAKRTWLQRKNGTVRELHQQTCLLDPEVFEVNNDTARSMDGTEVDYVTLSPRSKTGPLRVLMTGYGAFGISFPRTYLDTMHGGISLVPWLESGGAFVIPYIRGGGERGEEWHQAARQEKRQRSYDDFIAVATELIRTGFTTAGKIGVFGSSNGGLLAAVVSTQRPDLFGAVVSDVPLTDMLRYHRISIGSALVHEYGDPNDLKMAEILRSYSPYHNVREGVQYPPFLVTVSTWDDRAGAGHARKFVARLQEAGVTHAYLLEEKEGGHMVSNAFMNAVLMSRRIAFLFHHLGG